MRSIILIAHNIRSTYNIGSILRTADGFGVEHIYFSGITPYPATNNDDRLPHISNKLTRQIQKTALGAIESVSWSHIDDVIILINDLKDKDYTIIGLEQAQNSTKLPLYKPPNKCAIILGEEVNGISSETLGLCDDILEIPMYGEKESFNIAQATAIALYAIRES